MVLTNAIHAGKGQHDGGVTLHYVYVYQQRPRETNECIPNVLRHGSEGQNPLKGAEVLPVMDLGISPAIQMAHLPHPASPCGHT